MQMRPRSVSVGRKVLLNTFVDTTLNAQVDDLQVRTVVCALVPAKNASALIALLSAHLPIPDLKSSSSGHKPGSRATMELQSRGKRTCRRLPIRMRQIQGA